ncbi:MAG TPA: metal-dependent hydrolase [Planctomycetaceae bacterium]|nr:metal-dependent hydrolase [Planctomycetaceae bacterium]HRE99843.1 MBL fold metallo-hydrolase [Pirellulaceae bacterium]
MRLHFLGTAGYHPNETRHTSCVMLPELGILIDAGTGFFRAREHVELPTLDVFLTHAHLDHTIGLTFLFDLLQRRDPPAVSVRQVTVHGDAEKLAAIERHLFSPLLFPIKPPCDFRPLVGRTKEMKSGAEVRWFPLDHPGGSLGYRIEHQGKSLAYVTDTTASPGADYVDAIRDVDVLVHECYFADGREDRALLTGHSCATPVAEVARICGARRLYLVHHDPQEAEGEGPDLEAMRRIFPETYPANDGDVIEI